MFDSELAMIGPFQLQHVLQEWAPPQNVTKHRLEDFQIEE